MLYLIGVALSLAYQWCFNWIWDKNSTTTDIEDSSVNDNIFSTFTNNAFIQTEKVIIMQNVNKISRLTQWKDNGKRLKRKECQIDSRKSQRLALAETSMKCISKSFFLKKIVIQRKNPFWNPNNIQWCPKFDPFPISWVPLAFFHQENFLPNFLLHLFYLLIYNFKLIHFCKSKTVSFLLKTHHVLGKW